MLQLPPEARLERVRRRIDFELERAGLADIVCHREAERVNLLDGFEERPDRFPKHRAFNKEPNVLVRLLVLVKRMRGENSFGPLDIIDGEVEDVAVGRERAIAVLDFAMRVKGAGRR